MSDAVSAISRPISFVPDTPIATNTAPKITLLPQSAAAEANQVAQEPGFAQTLEGYLNELRGPEHIINAAADARADEAQSTGSAQAPAAAASVGDAVKSFLSDVSTKVVTSDAQTRDVLTGKNKDIGAVTASVEEADLALDFTLALTKRLTSAVQTIQQMQF